MTDAARALASGKKEKKPKKEKKAKAAKGPKAPGAPGSVWIAAAIASLTGIGIAGAVLAPDLIPVSAGVIAGAGAILLAITAAAAWNQQASQSREWRAQIDSRLKRHAAESDKRLDAGQAEVNESVQQLAPLIDETNSRQSALSNRFDKMEAWIQQNALPMVEDPETALQEIITAQQTAVERVRRELGDRIKELETRLEQSERHVESRPWNDDMQRSHQEVESAVSDSRKAIDDLESSLDDHIKAIQADLASQVQAIKENVADDVNKVAHRLSADQLEQVELVARRVLDGHILAKSLGEQKSRPVAR